MKTDTITITGNELHAFAARIAQITKEQIMAELKQAGMLLSENEAKEYKKYKSFSEVYLKQREVAKLLNVSDQTVMRMRDKGLLKVKEINGKPRYLKSQILAIKQQAV